MNTKLYRFLQIVLSIVYGIFLPWKFSGIENLPREGGIIVSSNHIHARDPFYIAAHLPRHIYFMAKVELFQVKIVGWFLKTVGAFPVNRGQSDLNAIRTSFRILKEGHALGIFPQGTRSRDNEHTQMAGGVALIALRANVPVVPVYIDGPYRPFRRTPVIVGKPVDLTDFGRKCDSETIAKATERIDKAIWSLKDTISRS